MTKILIIDDDPISLKICAHYLEPQFRIFVADNIEKAKSLILSEQIRVVLSDFWLKELSIEDLLAWRNRSAASVPVIGMSKFSDPHKMKQAIKMGLFDFIAKPVDRARLTECVTLALAFENDQWPAQVAEQAHQEMKTTAPAVLNFVNLQSIFGPDARLMRDLIKAFLMELDLKRSQMAEMLVAEEFVELHRNIVMLTHRLESSAAYIGAEELATSCRDIQSSIVRGESIQHGDIRRLVEQIQKLEKRLTLILESQALMALD